MGFSCIRHWLFMAVTICHLQPITDVGCQEQSVTARNSRRPAQGVKHIENDGGQCLSLTVIDDRKAVSQTVSRTFRGGLPHWGTVGKTLGTRRNACGNGWERKQRGGRRKILPPELARNGGACSDREKHGRGTEKLWRFGDADGGEAVCRSGAHRGTGAARDQCGTVGGRAHSSEHACGRDTS